MTVGRRATELLAKLHARIATRRRGQTMTEYALIVAGIAAVLLGGYRLMGNELEKLINGINGRL
jgi:Flp pilus assembly pilin Flp